MTGATARRPQALDKGFVLSTSYVISHMIRVMIERV